ncbi:hypothetical protein EDD29_1701 [Actinocorallia herbida]|uniref:Lipoprotein antigen n=1 Tax=Actinocorallia herbida TaxID=58109 RepID=A0A3N1CSA6_9ACTN|nr:hypothetical protein [Actinocorallia herbida]ROO84183.1 hypothetical protein EDD29_1701 [Actinocorallia herbida]
MGLAAGVLVGVGGCTPWAGEKEVPPLVPSDIVVSGVIELSEGEARHLCPAENPGGHRFTAEILYGNYSLAIYDEYGERGAVFIDHRVSEHYYTGAKGVFIDAAAGTATVDADLVQSDEADEIVHVKGTITCP